MNHYTFKQYDHQSEPISQIFATVKKSRTAIEWHSIMIHAFPETIMHLKNSINDVIISDVATAKIFKTNKCETCALIKSHVQISRTSHKSETSDKSFYRIFFDLMQFNTAYNGDQWCSHLTCMVINFNLAYTHSHKSETKNILKQVFMLIKQRYNGIVVFLRVDSETSLNLNFLDELKELKILIRKKIESPSRFQKQTKSKTFIRLHNKATRSISNNAKSRNIIRNRLVVTFARPFWYGPVRKSHVVLRRSWLHRTSRMTRPPELVRIYLIIFLYSSSGSFATRKQASHCVHLYGKNQPISRACLVTGSQENQSGTIVASGIRQ